MRDIHPFLVLSHRAFNQRTSLVIGLPMTTAEYNSDNPFAVAVGVAKGGKEGKTSYVLCHQPKSFAKASSSPRHWVASRQHRLTRGRGGPRGLAAEQNLLQGRGLEDAVQPGVQLAEGRGVDT